MKRIASTGLVVLASVLLLASHASAVAIFFDAPSTTMLSVGQQVTIDVKLDTEGETQMTSVFVSVEVDPAVLEFVEGTSPGAILFNASTFESLSRASQPFVLVTDPDGAVRAVSFAGLEGTGIASADQQLASLTFEAVGVGSVAIDSLIQQGDDVTVSGVSIKDDVVLGSSSTITVPEPASVLMSLSALGTICLIRRYKVG